MMSAPLAGQREQQPCSVSAQIDLMLLDAGRAVSRQSVYRISLAYKLID